MNYNSQRIKQQYRYFRKYALCLLNEVFMFWILCHYMKLSSCEHINDYNLLCFNYFRFYRFSTVGAKWNKENYDQGNYSFIMKF